jgi:hypothetical protein
MKSFGSKNSCARRYTNWMSKRIKRTYSVLNIEISPIHEQDHAYSLLTHKIQVNYSTAQHRIGIHEASILHHINAII